MRLLGLTLLAAVLAAVLVLPAAAQDCIPNAPAPPGETSDSGNPASCLPLPPSSVEVSIHAGSAEADLTDLGSPGVLIPLEAVIPMPLHAVEVVPLAGDSSAGASAPVFSGLDVPMRYQDPGDVSCGVQALGMALDGLGGGAPESSAMLGFLQSKGMMYDFGTGVEELAYAAQSFGYKGSYSFHDGTLADLQAQLDAGRPVTVALGTNGEGAAGHFVTVTGISPDGQWVSYNDPTLGKQTISAEEFQRLWGLQGNSAVVVAKEPPSNAPDPAPWVAMAAASMALVSASGLGLQRKGIGGRIDAGAGTTPRRSAPASKPASKPKPKPASSRQPTRRAVPLSFGIQPRAPSTPVPPTPTATATLTPSRWATGTLAPSRTATATPPAVVTQTPKPPPGYQPGHGNSRGVTPADIIKWDARAIGVVRGVGRAQAATALTLRGLDGGYVSVSAPSALREELRLAGTRYLPSTVEDATRASLLRAPLRGVGLGVSALASVGTNLYEYGLGPHKNEGIGSQKFWVSTGVDFGMAVGTGLAAAGVVAGTLALVAAAGFTAAAAAPVGLVIAATVAVGFGLSLALDHFEAGRQLKDKVNDGLDAWKGIAENAKVIGEALPGYINEVVIGRTNRDGRSGHRRRRGHR